VNARTAVLGVALVVVAVVLLIVLSGGDDSDSDTTTSGSAVNREAEKGSGGAGKGAEAEPKPEVTTIVVGKDGKPVGGVAEIDVNKGDEVRFKVKSAIAEEIHVHGYDLMKDVPAGGTVTFEFPAELEGIFEAELEGQAEQILELRVEP
jgi:FtsP/CotA-like multicopper oxidase with cupredoxin domain